MVACPDGPCTSLASERPFLQRIHVVSRERSCGSRRQGTWRTFGAALIMPLIVVTYLIIFSCLFSYCSNVLCLVNLMTDCLQQVAFGNLIQRNARREVAENDAVKLRLPFIVVNTRKKTSVDCWMSDRRSVSRQCCGMQCFMRSVISRTGMANLGRNLQMLTAWDVRWWTDWRRTSDSQALCSYYASTKDLLDSVLTRY
jgi:Transcription factor DP